VVRRGKTRVLSAEQAHVLGRRSQQFEERFDRPRTRNSGSRAEVCPCASIAEPAKTTTSQPMESRTMPSDNHVVAQLTIAVGA